jgi:hypothetical protein
MSAGKNLIAIAVLFFVFAAVFSTIFWADVSAAAKVGMFALGFGSGSAFGGWLLTQNAKAETH